MTNPGLWAEDDYVQALRDFRANEDTPHARAFEVVLSAYLWRQTRIERRLEQVVEAIHALIKAHGG